MSDPRVLTVALWLAIPAYCVAFVVQGGMCKLSPSTKFARQEASFSTASQRFVIKAGPRCSDSEWREKTAVDMAARTARAAAVAAMLAFHPSIQYEPAVAADVTAGSIRLAASMALPEGWELSTNAGWTFEGGVAESPPC